MKIAKVVGKLTLSKAHPSLTGRRWVIAMPLTLPVLAGKAESKEEEIIVSDDLGAGIDSLIGLSDGREAAAPYEPERKPVDAYAACILDGYRLNEDEVNQLINR